MSKLPKILGFGLAAMLAGAGAMAGPNDGGVAPANLPAGSAPFNHGQILCTAAMNSDGTVAGGSNVNTASTFWLATGSYQVVFQGACTNITAARGWARIVQVDTLTTGAIGDVKCTTADRAGNINGVFVYCTNGAGTTVDTSFFLFVLR